MKNLLIFFFTFCLFYNFSYASFPVKRTLKKVEVIKSNSPVENINAVSTVAATAAADVNIGGFFLGLLLGLIGVGLAYIFSNDDSFRRSSWYGLGVWVIILLLLGSL